MQLFDRKGPALARKDSKSPTDSRAIAKLHLEPISGRKMLTLTVDWLKSGEPPGMNKDDANNGDKLYTYQLVLDFGN